MKDAAGDRRKKKPASAGGEETKHIRCERCGKDAVVAKTAQRAKYCEDCRKDAKREQNKKYREQCKSLGDGEDVPAVKELMADYDEPEKGDWITGRCNICGDIFSYQYTGVLKTRCGIHRYTKSNGSKKNQKKKKRASNIDAIQRAAQAAGMSYGKYMARLAMQEAKKGGESA